MRHRSCERTHGMRLGGNSLLSKRRQAGQDEHPILPESLVPKETARIVRSDPP